MICNNKSVIQLPYDWFPQANLAGFRPRHRQIPVPICHLHTVDTTDLNLIGDLIVHRLKQNNWLLLATFGIV